MIDKLFNQPPILIRKVLGHITLFYAILIFLGFYEINSFYEKFNIGIYQFISTGEILVTFMPTVMNIIRLAFIFDILKGIVEIPWFSIIIIPLLIFIISKNRRIIRYENTNVSNKRYSWVNKFFNEDINKTYIQVIILLVLTFVTNYKVIVWKNFDLPNFKTMWNSNLHFYTSGFRIYWLLFVYIVCIYYWIHEYLKNKPYYKNYIYYVKTFIIFIFILGNLVIKTNMQVSQIRHKVPFEYVSFNYLSDTIKSNDSLVFLGNSRDFIFLRNLDSNRNKNFIYNLKDVQNLTFVKSFYKPESFIDKIKNMGPSWKIEF